MFPHEPQASGEFTAFCLTELKQTGLPFECLGILCRLATANQRLPNQIVKTRIAQEWSIQMSALADEPGPKTCAPQDFERAMVRLSQMPKEHAVQLVQKAARLRSKELGLSKEDLKTGDEAEGAGDEAGPSGKG